MIFLAIPLLLNLWIWKIFFSDVLIFLLVVVTAFLLNFSVKDKSKLTKPFIFVFVLLLFAQFQTTKARSLTNLTNDQIRIRDMRLREYPPTYIKIDQRAKWFSVNEWFEEGKGFRAFNRMLTNLSEVVDPNLYYFSNHPRERVGVDEFEKFPYIFLPFAAYGIIKAFEKKEKIFLLSFIGPLILISIVGNDNYLGPFSLFPFVVLSTSTGLKHTYSKLNKQLFTHTKLLASVFFLLTILALIQMYSYNAY